MLVNLLYTISLHSYSANIPRRKVSNFECFIFSLICIVVFARKWNWVCLFSFLFCTLILTCIVPFCYMLWLCIAMFHVGLDSGDCSGFWVFFFLIIYIKSWLFYLFLIGLCLCLFGSYKLCIVFWFFWVWIWSQYSF